MEHKIPEGPEVRTNSEQLGSLLEGRRLSALKPLSGKLAREGIPGATDFEPGTVTSVKALGKLIIIKLDHGGVLTSTLGMSGWWYPGTIAEAKRLYANQPAYLNGIYVNALDIIEKALKHERIGLISDGEQVACFTDPRNFGNMSYYATGLPTKVREKIGIDLLNDFPSWDDMQVNLRLDAVRSEAPRRILNMKMGDLALEQSFIAGLGNIYRAETFWLTGLNPHTQFKELTHDNWVEFCVVGSTVLENAYRTKGLMWYSYQFIERCTGIPLAKKLDVRGHLCYGKIEDIYGNKIVRDESFGRVLWRLE